MEVMNSPRFMDKAPAQIYAGLLDEGVYYCSSRTMYRILESQGQVLERRAQRRRQNHPKPELVARGPNEVWSWDITKLKGPEKWLFYYLYVIMDIYSRYVVGWCLAERECAKVAEMLILETCEKHEIQQNMLGIHSDRGSPMKAKTVAHLLGSLGVNQSFSRPRVSNDNPFSESQFKTMKYCPEFPGYFGCIEDGSGFCRKFFGFYNNEHYHSGIGLMTPESVHYRKAGDIYQRRSQVLVQAARKHPERFVRKDPKPPQVPGEVWINNPALALKGSLID